MSFLFVILGTVLSFATGLSIGRLAIESIGVGMVLVGCAGVLASLAASARADERAPTTDSIAAAE